MTEQQILQARAASRIYEHDGEALLFDATVLSVEGIDGGYAIELDRTAFFPGGGGQSADTGVLASAVPSCVSRHVSAAGRSFVFPDCRYRSVLLLQAR